MTAPSLPHPRWRTAPFVFVTALCLSVMAPCDWKVNRGAAAKGVANAHVIGTFPVSANSVVDGDTIRVPGRRSVRVLCVDAEETFKNERHRLAAQANFEAYAREMRGDSRVPVKFGTPAGEAAAAFARRLVAGATAVRLERDEANGRDEDPFGRTLAYVIVVRPQGQVNLSEALIRAGHSPYFVKYGRSRRFHDRLRRAQDEARAARRGIWGSDGPAHYPDYEERLRWWHAREKQLQAWEAIADRPAHVTLGTEKADEQLRALVGEPVTVFGSFERLIESKTSDRKIIILSHRPRRGLPLVVFDKAVFAQLDLHAIVSMYCQVTGTLSLYRGRPQIIVRDPGQVVAK